jgi:hypothetical protein
MAKEKIVLTAQDFDKKVQRLMFVKQELDALSKEREDLLRELEGQYKSAPSEIEVIKGINYKMEKVPVNQGRNTYDAEKLIPFIKAIRGAYNKIFKKVVIRKMDIDVKALQELVNTGKLPEGVLNKCRKDKWTFRSMFKKVEEDVTTTLENKKTTA